MGLMKVKLSWKGVVVGSAIELLSILLVFFDGGSLMCGFESIGTVGILLNTPGMMVADALPVTPIFALVLVVGGSLLFWIGIASLCFGVYTQKHETRNVGSM